MEYYIAKGQRRREERAAASTAEKYRPSSFQLLTEMKSLETSTTSNTIITTPFPYDDSDDELGDFVYRTSLTAQRLREKQKLASSTSTKSTTTRRRSSRLEGIRSKEDKEKEKSLQIISSSTANKEIDKRVIRSNKRKAAEISAADDGACKEVAGNIKRVYRNGKYHRLCSSNGCSSLARRGGVCMRHGAKRKTGSQGCNNFVLKRVFRNGRYSRLCLFDGCTNIAQKEGVCVRHGAKRTTCSYEGCPNKVVNRGVCVKHGAVIKRKVCSHD